MSKPPSFLQKGYGYEVPASGFERRKGEYLPQLDLIKISVNEKIDHDSWGIEQLTQSLEAEEEVLHHERGHLVLGKRCLVWTRVYTWNLFANLSFLAILEDRKTRERMVKFDRDVSGDSNDPELIRDLYNGIIEEDLINLASTELELQYMLNAWRPVHECYAEVVEAKFSDGDTVANLSEKINEIECDQTLQHDLEQLFPGFSPLEIEENEGRWALYLTCYKKRLLESVAVMVENLGEETAFKLLTVIATSSSTPAYERPPSTIFQDIIQDLEQVAGFAPAVLSPKIRETSLKLIFRAVPEFVWRLLYNTRYNDTFPRSHPKTDHQKFTERIKKEPRTLYFIHEIVPPELVRRFFQDEDEYQGVLKIARGEDDFQEINNSIGADLGYPISDLVEYFLLEEIKRAPYTPYPSFLYLENPKTWTVQRGFPEDMDSELPSKAKPLLKLNAALTFLRWDFTESIRTSENKIKNTSYHQEFGLNTELEIALDRWAETAKEILIELKQNGDLGAIKISSEEKFKSKKRLGNSFMIKF